jgi:predicted esterase
MGDASKPLSTRDVPAEFLPLVLLTGLVPWRISPSDPHVSYSLYVPGDRYDPAYAAPTSTPTSTPDPQPSSTVTTAPSLQPSKTPQPPEPINGRKLPLLVVVHGTGRRTSALESPEFVAFAHNTPCAILAVLFPTGITGPYDLDSYKLLSARSERDAHTDSALRSDLALLAILSEVSYRWPGIDTGKVFMMGFSGGGQFAHRFLYLYPEKLGAVSIGAPGRVTYLSADEKWPRGIRDVKQIFGREVDLEKVRAVKGVQLVIGSEDTSVHGGEEFWDWVREMKSQRRGKNNEEDVDEGGLDRMTKGRLESLRELQASWKELGIEAGMEIIQGMKHTETSARGVVLEFLRTHMLS